MFINIVYNLFIMVMGIGWLINILKSIFKFGSKDARTLEEDESKSDIRKSKLRIQEDKLRLKQTETQEKERKNERKEDKEIGEMLGGETLKEDLKNVESLIHQDRKILGELYQDEREASKVEAIGEKIEKEDQEGMRDEYEMGTGQSPQATEDQRDIQIQQGEIQLEGGRKKVDSELSNLYHEKFREEVNLYRTLKAMEKEFPYIQGDDKGYVGERLEHERRVYNILSEDRGISLQRIQRLTQQISDLEHLKAE